MRLIPAALLLLLPALCCAVQDESNHGNYDTPCTVGPDQVVPGFLVNMGPTGARGILRQQSFVVRYIFPESPAAGVLQIDDEVLGANGTLFSPHSFGGAKTNGIDGPIRDLGLAIEDSEGSDGKLTLRIRRGSAERSVTIQLEQLGRFADTFPVNCQKSAILLTRAYDYLRENGDRAGPDGQCALILAMLSADDPKVVAHAKSQVYQWTNAANEDSWSWNLGFIGIALAEYHLLTGDDGVLPGLRKTVELIRHAQIKGSKIDAWRNHDDETERQLEGGFTHNPFPKIMARPDTPAGEPSRKGGYGPLQPPTILCALAYSLSEQCGIKLEHDGLDKAFAFIEHGTNAGGQIAYGMEWLGNPGWQSRTGSGGSYKSSLAQLAYMLNHEREGAQERMALLRGNVDRSYQDMSHGHASSVFGLTWGLIGVAACDDEELKRKVFAYYMPWLNMARCHGSASYINLPARDHADGDYYRGNARARTTAMAAMLYSFATPKLVVQGVQLAIPGVNHKTLTGAPRAAYEQIVAGHFGKAARTLSTLSADPTATTMLAFLSERSEARLAGLQQVFEQGDWHRFSEQLNALRPAYTGVAPFDQQVARWDAQLASASGQLLERAGGFAAKGDISKAMQALDEAIASGGDEVYTRCGQAFRTQLEQQNTAFIAEMQQQFDRGAWSTLADALKTNGRFHEGIASYDTVAAQWNAALATADGRKLSASHADFINGLLGQAFTGSSALKTSAETAVASAAAQLCASTEAAITTAVQGMQGMFAQGEWNQLKAELKQAKRSLGGAPAFDEASRTWQDLLSHKAGKQILRADKELAAEEIGAAAKAIARIDDDAPAAVAAVARVLQQRIDQLVSDKLANLRELEQQGDWYTLAMQLKVKLKRYAGAPAFDQASTEWGARMKDQDVRTAMTLGAQFHELKARWQQSPSDALRGQIKAFARQFGDSLYGKRAAELIE